MAQAVKLVKGGNTVWIEATKIDEDLINTPISFELPVIKDKQDIESPNTLIIDIKKVKHIFTIAGFLSATVESGNSGTYADAKAVRDALIKDILYAKGDIQLYIRGYADSDISYSSDGKYKNQSPAVSFATDHMKVSLIKITITDGGISKSKEADSPERYNITIAFLKGVVK